MIITIHKTSSSKFQGCKRLREISCNVGAKSWLQPIYIMTNLWFIGVILSTLFIGNNTNMEAAMGVGDNG